MRSRSRLIAVTCLASSAWWLAAGCGTSSPDTSSTTGTTTTATTTGTTTTVTTTGPTSATTGGGQGGSGGIGTGGAGGVTTTSTGGGGGTGGTGGAGGAAPLNQTCATAEVHQLVLDGMPLTINGTTAGSMDTFHGTCGDVMGMGNAPDVVYELDLPVEGTFKFSVVQAANSTLQPLVLMRTVACDMDDNPPNCFGVSATEELIQADFKAGKYWFIIDGQMNTAGAFQLTAGLTTAACGDGVLNPGEQCDLGPNPPMGSGCFAPGTPNQCQFTAPPAFEDQCPGQQIAIPANTMNVLEDKGTNVGFTDDYAGICGGTVDMPGAGKGGRDRVYNLVPQASGMMTVTVGDDLDGMTPYCTESVMSPPCWQAALYVRTICTDITSELACDAPLPGPANKITFPVTANTPYYVIVDGQYDDDKYAVGTYNLFVTLQ